jgi:peroxiredoxin Q/BCP
MSVAVGKQVPPFHLPATGGQTIDLETFRGRALVLYFYPKDSTPGCTKEGQAFRDLYDRFQAAGADVVGVSRDSVRSHENFKAKQAFPFELLADQEEALCRAFEVIKEKNMYGRKVLGIERSTFLIDAEGVLRREWRGVKVDGHAEAVLEAVKAL